MVAERTYVKTEHPAGLLVQLEWWPRVPHEDRRLAVDTVRDMQRMGATADDFEALLVWLAHRVEAREKWRRFRQLFGGGR